MKRRNLTVLASLLAVLAAGSARGATITNVSDNFNTTTVGNGFTLGQGVNTDINPPTTNRMTGTVAANLRYMYTQPLGGLHKDVTNYDIGTSRLRVTKAAESGRFTLSDNGSTIFDFSSGLGTRYASPANRAEYDVKIAMRNDATGTQRFSFVLSTADGNTDVWDFGVQLYYSSNNAPSYTLQKRVDQGSYNGATTANNVGDKNLPIVSNVGSRGSVLNIVIRVSDAGAESGENYNSRVQVSVDNGATFIYDSNNDSDLLNRFRFDGPARYIVFDQANQTGATAGNVFYDNFSIVSTYAPPPPPERIWTGEGTDNNWSTADNWGGLAPVNGDPLVFNGTTRQANNNDLSELTVPMVTFNNGGFTLAGNVFTNTMAISNLAGINVLAGDLEWGTTGSKIWSIASGSELVLNNTNTVEINGDHFLYGGGTLRQNRNVNIGQLGGVANPAFSVMEGLHIIDGGSFISRGSYRVGSLATAAGGAQTILTNGALLYVTATGGSARVGDSANPVTSRLLIDNSTFKTDGTTLGIPYAVGATGEVAQVGGTVSGCPISFCYLGSNKGTYSIKDGTLETPYIEERGSGGLSYMYFDNAVLRPTGTATNIFMSGLDLAEIQSGGLTIDAQADAVIAPTLSGTGGLTKTGGGTLTLNGANTYAGNTLVNSGSLILSTGQNYPGQVQVADNATLGVALRTGGASLTNGNVSLGSGAGGSATLNFDLGASSNPTVPLMTVNNLSASSIVTINVANGFHLTAGRIVLVDYSGSIGGLGYGAFVLGNPPSGTVAELVNNTSNGSIELNITSAPGLLWTGAISGDWDSSNNNWFDTFTHQPSVYSDNQVVDFRDGAATGVINLLVNPVCSTIIVSNDTLPYVWTGGTINTPLLKKNGPGSLTRLEGADSITTLELNAGSYVVSNATDTTFYSVLTDTSPGTGTFVKRGVGPLRVNAVNDTYNGTTVIQEGILFLGATRSLGATNATIIITNGGTLELDDHQPKQPVIVSGAGFGGIGAIIDSTTATGVEENFVDVTLAGDTTFGCPNGGRWDLRVNNTTGPGPGLRGNGFNLTKVGSGSVSIACARTTTGYWSMNLGDVFIREGGLTFAESLTPGNPSAALVIYPGANLNVFDLGLTNPLVRNISMTNAMIQCGGASSDTNIIAGTILMSGDCRFNANKAHLIIQAPISGVGSVAFNATEPGTLLLNGVNSYTGDTIITNGTFGGTGVLAGNLVMLGGTNAPGSDGVGTLTVNGDVTLAGTTRMELDRSRSPNSDRLVVGGTLAFGGVLQVVLGAGAPAPQAGDVYQLFSKGSSTEFTAPIQLPNLTGLPGDLTWDTSQLQINGTISVLGTITPPTIGSTSLSGNNFTFSGTGGIQDTPYHVISSPDVAAPLAAWIPVASNVFGAGGSFSFTTNIVGGAPKAFFRLQVP